MFDKNVFVNEANSFLGWGMLTGSTRDAFERCHTLEDALVMIPACTRGCAQRLIKQVGLEEAPEVTYFVAMGILGDTDFSSCAKRFPREIADKLVKIEGLFHGQQV